MATRLNPEWFEEQQDELSKQLEMVEQLALPNDVINAFMMMIKNLQGSLAALQIAVAQLTLNQDHDTIGDIEDQVFAHEDDKDEE